MVPRFHGKESLSLYSVYEYAVLFCLGQFNHFEFQFGFGWFDQNHGLGLPRFGFSMPTACDIYFKPATVRRQCHVAGCA